MNGPGTATAPGTTRENGRDSGTLYGIPVGVVHNLFSMYGLYCSNYLLVLVTLPYLSRVLGPAAWGLIAAAQSFGAYLLLTVEYGFPLSAAREAARLRSDRAALRDVLAGVLGAKLALSAAGMVVAAAAWRWLPVFHGHAILLGAGVFLAVAQGSNAIWFFQGLERMRLFVAVDLTAKTCGVIATFALIHGPADDWKVLALQGAASATSLAISLGLAWREVGFRVPTLGMVGDALRRGLATFIPRNASLLSTVGNAFLLSLFAPPLIVGYYAGADRISRAIAGLLTPASEAVYPRISHLARRSTADARRLARLAAALVGAAAILMAAALFLLAPYLVRTLLGPGFEPSVPVLRILSLLPPALVLRNVLGIHWMLPLDLERPLNAIMLGAGLLNILLAVLIAPRLGGIGVAWVLVGSQGAASLGTYLVLKWMGLDPLHTGPARALAEQESDTGPKAVKVLHIVGESKFGGASVIINDLAGLARKQGWQADVLTTDRALTSVLNASGVGVVSLPVIWRNIRPLRDLRGLWRLYRFLKSHPYQLVHTHTSKGGFVGRLAAWMAGTPAIVHTVHGFAFHEQSGPFALHFYTMLERMAAHWCHRIITVSEFHRRWGLALGIGDENKMVAIPNGVAPQRIERTRSRKEIRAECGTAEEEFVIVSTVRLAESKGLEDLLEAIAIVRQKQTRPFCAWIAGDGPSRAALEARSAALGLTGAVRFLGFRRDVGNLLEAADLVALPSLWEGLSIALLEAMAAGKPIVTTTIASNVEATNVGEAAQLVCPRDPGGLARAIVDIMGDPLAAEQLGTAARRIYVSRYTQGEMLRRYAEQYRQVLSEYADRARPPEEGWAAKRTLDLLVAGPALLALSGVMALLALAVRLTSPGPALFRQDRLGRDGVAFTLYKFRTMRVGASDRRNSDGSTYNGPDDTRVTRLGRFLRATSLDELPQLINVVRGDMSLVGPRPELLDQLRFYSESDKRRLLVRPGITGLAQLSGRNSLAWGERRQLDLEYVERRSLRLDLSILFRTLPYVLRRRGIYATRQSDSIS